MKLYCSKFEEVARRLEPACRNLLDVGCRDGRLRRHLPSAVDYVGIDLTPSPAVSRVCNIEEGIPFQDAAFDTVVALDVLEHTDNIWYAFSELVRVARRQVMVVLPNTYHWRARLRFLRGREADKYKLTPEPIEDRHRWLPSYCTALAFAQRQAEKFNLGLDISIMLDERPNLGRALAARVFSLNLMCANVFFDFLKVPRPSEGK